MSGLCYDTLSHQVETVKYVLLNCLKRVLANALKRLRNTNEQVTSWPYWLTDHISLSLEAKTASFLTSTSGQTNQQSSWYKKKRMRDLLVFFRSMPIQWKITSLYPRVAINLSGYLTVDSHPCHIHNQCKNFAHRS